MINIRKLLSDHKVKYWTEGKNVTEKWTNIQCPACNDQSNHGGFDPTGEKYNCWKCGSHHIFKILKSILKTNPAPIAQEYKYSTIIKNKINKIKIVSEIKIPGTVLLDAHKKYLIERKFSPIKLQKEYNLKGTDHIGSWKFRIIAPIHFNNRVVSFQSRAIKDQELRYKTCPKEQEIIHHKHVLYNIDNCKADKMILVEGITDVWRLGENCAATFGIGYTRHQLLLLKHYKQIFIIFDNEIEAQERAKKIADTISLMGVATSIVKIDTKDPASLSQYEANKIKRRLI